jgi:CheY-like chemotaxis protein
MSQDGNVRININVSEETREKWKALAKRNDLTLTNLIRESVESYSHNMELKELELFFHNLKEELGSIKLASQMLIEEFKEKLDFTELTKINLIYEKSLNIEKILQKMFGAHQTDKEPYDVLIVDDDDATIYLLSDFFKKKGISTKTTSSASETLEILEFTTPKLILLDILLPDENGFEISKKIRSNKRLKKVPIYYITAVPKVDIIEKLKETGANGYILKPFDMQEFNEILNEIH